MPRHRFNLLFTQLRFSRSKTVVTVQGFGFANSIFLHFAISSSTDTSTLLLITYSNKDMILIDDSSLQLETFERVSYLHLYFVICLPCALAVAELRCAFLITKLMFCAVSGRCFPFCCKSGSALRVVSVLFCRKSYCLGRKFRYFYLHQCSDYYQCSTKLCPLHPHTHSDYPG